VPRPTVGPPLGHRRHGERFSLAASKQEWRELLNQFYRRDTMGFDFEKDRCSFGV